jgi:ion channel-forming bestrophin family protein
MSQLLVSFLIRQHESDNKFSIIGMVDQLTAMERVANTPIPVSCEHVNSLSGVLSSHDIDGIHLKQCVTLYLFALPLTLFNELGWAMIPVVTVVAFTFMGIEGIADDIEMPFGKFASGSVRIAVE